MPPRLPPMPAVRTSCTGSRRPRWAARAADSGRRGRAPTPLPRGRPLAPGRLARKAKAGLREPGESRRRGGFDTGTPRGGSIGLMRSTWEGRPIADKRTAAAPVSNPPLCFRAADASWLNRRSACPMSSRCCGIEAAQTS